MKGFLGMISRIQLRCIVCFQIYGILEYCKYYSNEVRRDKKQVSLYIMGRKLKTILCSYSVEERKLLSYVTEKESHGFPHALASLPSGESYLSENVDTFSDSWKIESSTMK